MKFWVVPESDERCTGVIEVLGSDTPALMAAIAGSFHLLILPVKICAATDGVRFSLLSPDTLKMTASGVSTIGRSIAVPPEQRASALAVSGAFSAASEPAQGTCFCSNWVRPPPEPSGL